MAITSRDIANRLNISHVTVTRALREQSAGKVSAETRKRILQAAEELGYRTSSMGRALATGRTNIIQVRTPMYLSPYYGEILQLIAVELSRDGYAMSVENNHSPAGNYGGRLADGLLLIDEGLAVEHNPDSLGPSGLPAVSIGAGVSDCCDHVYVDLRPAVREAIAHLVNVGRQRIAFVAEYSTIHNGEARTLTYEAFISELGRAPEHIAVTSRSRHSARESVGRYISERGVPDGLLCHNDELAVGVIEALRCAGRCVPADVSVVGCDGVGFDYFHPELTSIHIPLDEMCRAGWAMLRERLADPGLPIRSKVITPVLNVRESSIP